MPDVEEGTPRLPLLKDVDEDVDAVGRIDDFQRKHSPVPK